MIQPWFCSHYPISIFLPLGSRLIILCLFQTQLSIPIQNFFFIFVPLPMQNGKLTLSSQFFPSLLLEVSTTQQQIHFPNLHDTLKHFLKNSTIAYLLEGQTSDHFIHRAQVNTFPGKSLLSHLQQPISANPHYRIKVDLYEGTLLTSCRWLPFSLLFVRHCTLANQLFQSLIVWLD